MYSLQTGHIIAAQNTSMQLSTTDSRLLSVDMLHVGPTDTSNDNFMKLYFLRTKMAMNYRVYIYGLFSINAMVYYTKLTLHASSMFVFLPS